MKKATKTILFITLAIAIPTGLFLTYQYFRPPADVADLKADLTSGAVTIGTDYSTDEMKADAKYLGKTIDISGRVSDIQTMENGGITLYFSGGGEGYSVAVLLSPEATKKNFPVKGDSVLVRGICTGYLMDVSFNRGLIIKKY